MVIPSFDPRKQLRSDQTILAFGKRNSGKTTLMMALLYHMRKMFNCGIAVSPSYETVTRWCQFIPRGLVHDQFDETKNTEFLREIKRRYRKRRKKGGTPRTMFELIDDMGYDKKSMNSKLIKDMFMNGRQYGLFVLMLCQYMKSVGPDIRSNTDLFFIFRINDEDMQKEIYKSFFSCVFRSFDEFQDIYLRCTAERGMCCVLDVIRSNSATDWHDCVYWYKAPKDLPPFRLCDSTFHAFSELADIDDDDDGQDEMRLEPAKRLDARPTPPAMDPEALQITFPPVHMPEATLHPPSRPVEGAAAAEWGGPS